MNAGTRLIAVLAVIWALAATGGMGGQAKVASRAGCDEWGCGMNHNETLVRDGASRELADAGGQHDETLARDVAR